MFIDYLSIIFYIRLKRNTYTKHKISQKHYFFFLLFFFVVVFKQTKRKKGNVCFIYIYQNYIFYIHQ